MQRKVIFVVLDGVGIGALPDAADYGDAGTNTLANTARVVGGLQLPNLQRLGLGNIAHIDGVPPVPDPDACFGRMIELSKGKDSTTGHWEIAGIVTDRPFPTYPKGFPPELIDSFKRVTGSRGVLGNCVASGTTIIAELGAEHVRTGFPIIYTSADSVFQIAAHEEVIPLARLYEICEQSREQVCVGQHAVGRVIARPFIGAAGKFSRTTNRRDFSIEAPADTLLDVLQRNGIRTTAVGKIDDLFSGRGLDQKIHTRSNAEGIQQTLRSAELMPSGFIMTNLVDFDQSFGHRQDPEGMARALREFDEALPRFYEAMRDDDLLILTADHGNDPTDQSTDHSREHVPILCYRRGGKRGVNIGTRATFADAGKTVEEFFGVKSGIAGTSFLPVIL